MEFTDKDLQQIKDEGLTLKKVLRDVEVFYKGISAAKTVTAAIPGNGILQFSSEEKQKYINLYEEKRNEKDIVKFVPASGAATRMFKFLFDFIDNYNPEEETLKEFIKRNRFHQLETFLKSLSQFAFIKPVRKKIREKYPNYKYKTKGERCLLLAKILLEKDGLNYGNLPKGLIYFHKYLKYATTAFEEQLLESAYYASSRDQAFLHFTFTEEHLELFKQEFEMVKGRVEKKTKTAIHISYSFQNKNTKKLALTIDNKLFRDENNLLVFRPSGHGALIENLNTIDADVIFIKNIDNVVAEQYLETISDYKKMLAGKLVWLQEKIFSYMKVLRETEASEEQISEIKSFLWNELNCKNLSNSVLHLASILNRPLRVCGMVKNTGAPGGGPFWVNNEDNEQSIQIVESAQIDLKNTHQKNIFSESTHFNPVDIVCGVRDYTKQKFNLLDFVDPNTGFISIKSQNGKPLKALELPGLWNGAMAKWNTVFVEVPLSTFNPVKTVNDLLQKEHQPHLE